MSAFKIVLIIIGCIILGVLGGLLARSWYVAIGLPVVLVAFVGMWAVSKADASKKSESTNTTTVVPPTQDVSK